ncbi:aminotransferase class III-fold pyridoxal phosphate-dependent enzyme [Methanoculleus sp. YWC-01]|jgi:4-aminobutyrate aminotransferase|uniref:Aminotransferase class III-fold pyridoxal phosphate-dependent enzyme n=1 Tax=Methanoculleus nereidis TaxID=2735141 RepID=A0ABU3Z3D6_9EURY|nr:aminotransferase class III-fold pyridoxal phosphate-dependent enzyme [Methanoculleus sp. YWC-01]MDV4343327.1 aminotransferase class III-fold pyridoxal phosphate-dependent enzyme [Methanoculleus sp. YWC-01]PKL56768.1 MAG: hypothetical protein CVV35_03375 [Methanomicrobiales archaeon HGW-Methanomicrobiales-6]
MEPLIRVEPPGEKAREVLHRDAAIISPSTMRQYPLVLQKASGVNLRDVDANRYLDFAPGIAVMNVGWDHPQVVSAIRDQAEYLSHGAFRDFCSERPVQCGEELAGFLPEGLDRVYFSNSGAESVEAAMKLARYHTGRVGDDSLTRVQACLRRPPRGRIGDPGEPAPDHGGCRYTGPGHGEVLKGD